MRQFSKEQIEKLKEKASNEFETFSGTFLEDYNKYLKELYLEKIDKYLIFEKAFSKKENLSAQLYNFLNSNYPKSDEIVNNGIVTYTVDTIIHFDLMVNYVFPIDKKLNNSYQKFLKRFSEINK